MDILLIAGLWFDAGIWDEVVPELEALGHRGVPVLLPGQGDGADDASLADQVAAVLAAVDAADRTQGDPLVVGHSAASTLAWLAADARPDRIAGVAMLGGFPSQAGEAYADFFPVVDGQMPFPGWVPFAGPDSADLDAQTRDLLAARAIAVPEQVARGVVEYTDERRSKVPAVLVCPEFTPDDVRQWLADGHLSELAAVEHLNLVDLDSGHWPMISQPTALARVLAGAADTVRAAGPDAG